MPPGDGTWKLACGVALVCTIGAASVHVSSVALVAGGLVLVAALLFVRQAYRQRRLTRRLIDHTQPGEIAGIDVRLGPIRSAAFVAGLARPQIFCDGRLTTSLSPDELRAVALHEHAHQVARDPLRVALLEVVAPFLRPLPAGAAWLERQAARREIVADREALSRGASRAAIASALLQVSRFEPAGASGFARAVDLRLRALVDHEVPAAERVLRWPGTLTGLGLGGMLCALVLHPPSNALTSICC